MKTLTQNLIIPATTGERTISNASDVFPGWIDSDFKSWNLCIKGEKTEELKVEIQEMDKDGTFAEIFTNPEKMCLTQDQIISFCEEHRQWLRTDGYATLFLFKEDDEYFVAHVSFDGGGQLRADVRRLSNDLVWSAGSRRRVVLQQLTNSTSEPSNTQPLGLLETLHKQVTELQEKMSKVEKIIKLD